MENNSTDVSYRQHLERYFTNGRRTLLGVIVMTVLNIGLLLGNGDDYFIFSASVPYYLTALGKGMDGGFNSTYTWTGLTLSFGILAVYFLLWLLSKKQGKLLWAAVVLLCVDTAALIALGVLLKSIAAILVDLLFHIVAVYQIGKGAATWKQLQSLPPEITYTVVTEDL